MNHHVGRIEQERLGLQATLDSKKGQADRNRLGQFSTPTLLAQDILRYAVGLLSRSEDVRFLDPALGTGAFYSALRSVVPRKRIKEAVGFEIDPHYGEPAAQFWKRTGLSVELADFTRADPSPRFNILICNPPYVRHHHLHDVEKNRLQRRTLQASGMRIGGLAGLYCHFVGLSHAWMAPGAVAGWLIPSEFMDVNYGQSIKRYLLERVTLLHIHRFDPGDVQFADALVSSAVVWLRNTPPPLNHAVDFSFGGSLFEPKTTRSIAATSLSRESKWTRFPASDTRTRSPISTLSDFFQVKRGLATGHNRFFILSEDEIQSRSLPIDAFTPILPSPRYLPEDEVRPREDGSPDIERRMFLLDTKLEEAEIGSRFPTLFGYLQEGKTRRLHERYLCRHRKPWYAQEHRPAAPIVCTYLGRGDSRGGRPFRFILNGSRATVANVYLAMYPKPALVQALHLDPALMRRIWVILNSLAPDQLLDEGRVYGGGLHKLEPGELAKVDVTALLDAIPHLRTLVDKGQLRLFRADGALTLWSADSTP